MSTDLGALQVRRAERLSLFEFYQGEHEESQQGEHYNNQA